MTMTQKCETVLVPIPDLVWPFIYKFDPTHPEYGIDEQGRKCLALDEHVAPAVQALWAAGIPTSSCCCGHGEKGYYGGLIALPMACRADGERAKGFIPQDIYDALCRVESAAHGVNDVWRALPLDETRLAVALANLCAVIAGTQAVAETHLSSSKAGGE